MISIETHPDLYKCDWDNVRKSLEYAKAIPMNPLFIPVQFHYYWRVPKEVTRKQVLPLKAALATQDSQNTINLWSNVDLTTNELLKPLLPYMNFRIWNAKEELKDSIVKDSGILRSALDDPLCWTGGDLFRILVLQKYGGIYCDMDTVLLRDLNPLLNYEFMYQWGSSGTTTNEPTIRISGAVMRMNKDSKLSNGLLRCLSQTPVKTNTTCWGTDLYPKVFKYTTDWKIFPCTWFNTEWGQGIPLAPFDRNINGNNSDELYDGAFAWHWHNQWDKPIQPGCKFENIEKVIDQKFREKFNV